MDDKITILIVDDHPLVREGLQLILNSFTDFSVIQVVSNGEQAITACATLNPDVVLLDVKLPGMQSIDVLKKLLQQNPNRKVLMMTSFTETLNVQEALDNGAMGYLVKNAEIAELARAIRAAAQGKHTLSPEAVMSLIQSRPKPTPSGQSLTQRELDVLKLIVHGMTNHAIGQELSISVSTAKAYVAKVYKKLGVNSRAEAIAKAIDLRLISR